MKKILFADDQRIIHYGMKSIINGNTDYSIVDSVFSEDETLKKVIADNFDLLILDISMPKDNLYGFIHDIKDQKPDLPILVYSIYPEEHCAVKLIEMGISGYIYRTASKQEIKEAIEKVLEGGIYISPNLAEYYARFMKLGNNKPNHNYLSQREYTIFIMLASGMNVAAISQKLYLSKNTVANHRYHILRKIKVKNDVQLTLYAIKHDLLDPKNLFDEN